MAKADLRIEFPSAGATYSRDLYGVYEYGVYGRGSVLEGREKRTLKGQFDTLDEAKQAFPDAIEAGCGYREVVIPHTPPSWFDPDYAGERWDDDY
jgi:hypothetical protein